MLANVRLNYDKFPEIIQSGVVKISDDKSIALSVRPDEPDMIFIEVRDNTFGANYLNTFEMTYDTAKDFYNILYQLLKQIKDNT